MSRSPSLNPGAVAARNWSAVLAAELEDSIPRSVISAEVTFRQWCESLAHERIDPVTGNRWPPLKVDGKLFTLDDRPAMAWIYDQVPSAREEAFRGMLIIMKCAQVGFTVMEMLIALYLALKFDLSIGMYMPSRDSARTKSANRFVPMVRTVPEAYQKLIGSGPTGGGQGRRRSEGNVTTRVMGASTLHFLHTSGKTATESIPMGVVSFDEVQEMSIAAMEKVQERMSASDFKYTVMGSTANWPDADIHHWFKRGTQHRFLTRCPECGVEKPLDQYFPQCIKFDEDYPDRVTGIPGDWRYVCEDGHWIDDPQQGTWKPDNHEAAIRKNISIHFHQMLSPTISPREMIEAYFNADDLKNFYNRKLGKPYQDPSQIPVTLEHLKACAEAGQAAGLTWKTRARQTFMGIDQMGKHNVVVIKERMADGRQAVVHVEEIYDPKPFDRCDELMEAFGVQVCVVEELPNFNCAHEFAAKHKRRVFLGRYANLEDAPMRWGGGNRLNANERQTSEEVRTRWTVTMDQYKCMSLSLARITTTACLLPDAEGPIQAVLQKGKMMQVALVKERFFPHLQRTALVTERTQEGERKLRSKVVKIGDDPHFSYANMLCDVAYARAYGTTGFIIPEVADPVDDRSTELVGHPGLPASVTDVMEPLPAGEICGRCVNYPMGPDGPPAQAWCPVYRADVQAKHPHCAGGFEPVEL